jgi:hypothetical protein
LTRTASDPRHVAERAQHRRHSGREVTGAGRDALDEFGRRFPDEVDRPADRAGAARVGAGRDLVRRRRTAVAVAGATPVGVPGVVPVAVPVVSLAIAVVAATVTIRAAEPAPDESGGRTGETGQVVAETVVATAALTLARAAGRLPARERCGRERRGDQSLGLVPGRAEPIVVIPASHLTPPWLPRDA